MGQLRNATQLKRAKTHQLLVRNSNLDSLVRRAVLEVPILDEGNILSPDRTSTPLVVREWSVPQSDRIRRPVRLDLIIFQERLASFRNFEIILLIVEIGREDGVLVRDDLVLRCDTSRRDRVNDRVIVEGGEIGIFGSDVEVVRFVVRTDLDRTRSRVVEVGIGDFVLGTDLLTKDNLVDVVELVPVVVEVVGVAEEGFETRSTGNRNVQSFCREERFRLEKVVVVLVVKVGEEGTTESVQCRHLGEVEIPDLVRRTVDVRGIEEGSRIVEPVHDRCIFLVVEFELDRFKGFRIEDVVSIVERRFFVVERREPHTLEVPSIPLLPPHREPHRCPLGVVDWRDDLGDLVDESDRSRDVVNHGYFPHLLPRHRHVLE